MSKNQQQQHFRGHLGLPPSSTPTSTTADSAPLISTGVATPSHVLTFPLGSTSIFASPQLLSNSAAFAPPRLPLSFVSPSGQIYLSPPLPLSPSLPLISNTCLVPHPPLNPRQLVNLSFPFGAPSTCSLPVSHHLPAPLSVSEVEPLTSPQQAPVLIESAPVLTTSRAEHSKSVSTDCGQSLSVQTLSTQPQPPTASVRSPSLYPHPNPTLSQPSPLQTNPAPSPSPLSVIKSTPHETPIFKEVHHQTQKTHSKERSTTGEGSLKTLLTSVEDPSSSHDILREQLEGETDLSLFYQCFLSSPQSKHLHIEVLPSQGNLRWIQVRQKVFHIDPDLGPVVVARILVSSNGIVKLQLMFPVYKTAFTKLFVEQETENLLLELSLDHVICPGLPNYADKFSVLGYHPSHVRIFESTHVKRYDHEHCPVWHVPTGTFSKRDRTAQKMCKQCKYLQNSVVRLATKACEVDPAERESWTNPSSNRPLAYMSAADREERYRKLRQERNQMLVKLRAYEERLGIGGVGGEGSTSSTSSSSRGQLATKPGRGPVGEHLVSVSELPPEEEEREGKEGGIEGEGGRHRESVCEVSSDSEGGRGGASVTEALPVHTGVKRRSSFCADIRGKRPVKRAKSTST